MKRIVGAVISFIVCRRGLRELDVEKGDVQHVLDTVPHN
jgi:hypothetical protein